MEKSDYIGRYFERVLSDENEKYCFEIIGETEISFIVISYGLYLGFSTKEIGLQMEKGFLEKDNFREIPKYEFDIIKILCKDPYTTIWDENQNPTYVQHH